jgi:hypothetical protein
MKATNIPLKQFTLTCLMLICLSALYPAMAAAEGNISPDDKYAWSESFGWINFRTDYGSVTVHDTYLSGYAWAGNIGWISLGNSNGGPYQNNSAQNWGVNTDSAGNLSGYAWSEAAGWISFKTAYSQVTMDTEGRFDGYAWSQNLGWIHFKNDAPAYNVRKINIAPVLVSTNPELTGLTENDTDNEGVLISEILGSAVTDVGNGALEGIAIYSLVSGKGQWEYSADDGATWEPIDTVSETAALLLTSQDSIRFVPGASDDDSASFAYYAWDQTSGTAGEKADVSVRGDMSAFSIQGDTASVQVVLVIDVSGQITYFSNGEPVSQVQLVLEGEDGSSYTAETDEDGYFMISGMEPGNYTLRPSKIGNPGTETLSSADASKIARYVVRDYEFDEYQELAADVNENSRITGLDASDLARHSVGLMPEMNESGNHWGFVPDAVSYSSLSSDSENQDFAAVRLGDVSGNYSPLTQKPPRDRMLLKTGEIQVKTGERLILPIVLDSGTDIEGIDIRVFYDEASLSATDVSLAQGKLEYEAYQLVANTHEPGLVSAAIFATTGNLFTGDGVMVYIAFDVMGETSGAVIEFVKFECNERPVSPENNGTRDAGEVFGGFYTGGETLQRLVLRTGETVYDLSQDDLNRDGKIGTQDAVSALIDGNLKTAVRVLRCVSGKN